MKAAVAATVESYGRLDSIVNNAAISLHAEITDINDAAVKFADESPITDPSILDELLYAN